MEKISVAQLVMGVIGGGGLTMLGNYFNNKRKNRADSDSVEIDTSVKINREWERLYKEIRDEFHQYKEENEKEMQIFREQIEVLEDALIAEKKKSHG